MPEVFYSSFQGTSQLEKEIIAFKVILYDCTLPFPLNRKVLFMVQLNVHLKKSVNRFFSAAYMLSQLTED